METNLTISVGGVKPYLRLAPGNQVLICFILLFDEGKGFSQFDEVVVFVHPVVEEGELFDDLGFGF